MLPFLSLTEQSAKVYRNMLPELLEDTSQSRLDDDARLYSDRWRVPVIITTSVKFFESLFADRAGDCRRLHNIANSVIVFDEAHHLRQKRCAQNLKLNYSMETGIFTDRIFRKWSVFQKSCGEDHA